MVGHRYYNPEWGRWLSPDDIEYLDPQSINGLNLYAYCGNDPVNKYDPTGHSAIFVIALISGFISASANVVGQLVFDGKSFDELEWKDVGISFASGFVSGLIPGSGALSIVGQAVTSSFAENGLRSIVYGEEFSVGDFLKDTAVQIGTGFLLKGISSVTSKITNKAFIKANGYAQYQHYFRGKGFNYSVKQVYKQMYKHIKLMDFTNSFVEGFFDFGLSFISESL